MVKSIVGAPARGDDFYGRDRFVDLIWRELGKGSVLLAAPRRFGKTSVMYRLMDQPRQDYKIVHMDLQHLTHPIDLILELVVRLNKDTGLARFLDKVTAISRELGTRLRSTVDEVEAFDIKLKLREQVQPNWEAVGKDIFRQISQSPYPVLLILDEFPMMIDRMARLDDRKDEARDLLRWLRALRQSPDTANLRFLIAGSIGIDAVLNSLGEISAINDFQQVRLEPFPAAVADEFLVELAKSDNLPLTPECRQKMLELVGILVPYFLQILFSETSKAYLLTGEPVTPDLITSIYHEKVLGVDCKTYFDHYYGRLRDYYRPHEEKAVKRLLRELARVGEMTADLCFELYRQDIGGSPSVDEFNITLTNLENDFYIRYHHGGRKYEFACKLLRDWWLRHHGMEAV
jgi:hypothetical protein